MSPPAPPAVEARAGRALATALFGLVVTAIVRCAWIGDDAYVTLRTLDLFTHGLGLRFNPDERVQAFTHPLWLAVLALPYALTGDAWRMPMAMGVGVTVLALVGLARLARDAWGAAIGFAALGASKAAIDFATGGLENPLESLLLVGSAWAAYTRRPLWVLVLLASLIGLTRLDALALVGPSLVVAAVAPQNEPSERGSARWARAALATAPLVAWHGFALVYYGALLPNTAFAKLGTGIPVMTLAARSGWTFAWTARIDPVTLPAIACGLGAALVARDRVSLGLAAGVVAHLLWVVRIGGDFMGGRMFVAPLWVAVILLVRARWSPLGAIAVVGLTLLGLASPYAPLRSGPRYEKAPPSHGVVDERGYYWAGTGLWAPANAHGGPHHAFAADGRAARGKPAAVKSVIGLYGWAAGPGHHVVDRLGLADPLLARLPAEYDPDFRIGHFRRRVPPGYVAAVTEDHGLRAADVDDPAVRALYDDVRLATRAPLLAPGRVSAIARLLFHTYPIAREAWVYGAVDWLSVGAADVDVGEDGAGVVTTGMDGVLVWDLDPAGQPWTVVVERGDLTGRPAIARTYAATQLRDIDRVIARPAHPARVREVYRVPPTPPR